MLTLIGGNVGHGCKDICGVRSCTLDAVTVVNPSLSSLGIHIEVLKVVIKINGTSTEVTTEESSMGGEDRRNVNAPLPAEWETDTSKPFVEMRNDSFVLLMVRELQGFIC